MFSEFESRKLFDTANTTNVSARFCKTIYIILINNTTLKLFIEKHRLHLVF